MSQQIELMEMMNNHQYKEAMELVEKCISFGIVLLLVLKKEPKNKILLQYKAIIPECIEERLGEPDVDEYEEESKDENEGKEEEEEEESSSSGSEESSAADDNNSDDNDEDDSDSDDKVEEYKSNDKQPPIAEEKKNYK